MENDALYAADRAALAAFMRNLGQKARAALPVLSLLSTEVKNAALLAAAAMIRSQKEDILAANALDYAFAEKEGQNGAFLDRLKLDSQRIEAIAQSVEDVASLPDPLGQVMAEWSRPNGLKISRIRTALGVIGVIFESRPNVTADAGALAFKAGNPVILRTGSAALRSARVIARALCQGFSLHGVPEGALALVPFADRDAVGMMLAGLDGAIDVIVPRGGKSLVERVQKEARVPVFAHLDGNNHVYIHEKADKQMAKEVLLNAKMRRTGICGAAETFLIDEKIARDFLPVLLPALLEAGCVVRGDQLCQAMDERVTPATEADWSTEYLDKIIAAKVVPDLGAAINHIARYGSHHTDAIITADGQAAARFLREVDSAIVIHNASTQFADGGEFGFGGEIGIATGRMHARGPVGVEQLTSFKYILRGDGTLRP